MTTRLVASAPQHHHGQDEEDQPDVNKRALATDADGDERDGEYQKR